MSYAQRRLLKLLVSQRVRARLDSGGPNPLTSKADHMKDTIGSSFMALMPRTVSRRSIFGSMFEYEGGYTE